MRLWRSRKGCGGCELKRGCNGRGNSTFKLSDYGPGDKGVIQAVCGNPDFRLRLMEMGFVKGTEVKVVKYAPLTDPIEFVVKGYHLSLRREEAAEILMNEPEKAA